MKKSYELDLLNIIGRVLHERKLLFCYMFVGALFGVVVALSSPKFYSSEVELAPEFSGGGLSMSGGLSDIAASFGVDLGNSGSMDAIYPDLYPNVVSSTDFMLDLYDVPVRLVDDPESRSYIHHITKEVKFPFWNYPQIWWAKFSKAYLAKPEPGGGEADPFRISKNDWENIRVMRKSILCSVDRKSSVISIVVIDQDPVVAAIVADTVCNRLQTYITEYRTNKARLDVDYYRQLMEESKAQYDSIRNAYITYTDLYSSSQLMKYRARIEDLENEMSLQYNVFTQTSAMLKQAESKLQERTPAFTVLQRPVTPFKPSSMPRIMVVIIWAILGGLAAAAWILIFRERWQKRKMKSKE